MLIRDSSGIFFNKLIVSKKFSVFFAIDLTIKKCGSMMWSNDFSHTDILKKNP